MHSIKTVLVAMAALTAIGSALYLLRSQPTLDAKPENVHKCDNVDYVLELKDFQVDNDISPGQTVTMTSTFLSHAAGAIEQMEMRVYLGKVKLWTQDVTGEVKFNDNETVTYNYKITLPSLIPHLHVTMTLSFADATKAVLSCIAFDLHL